MAHQHFVRPDRVYATGVLTPIVGYQPAEAAQQVAARFVSGGQGLAGPQIQLFGRTRRRLSGSVTLLGNPHVDALVAKLRELFAGIAVRFRAARIRAQMKFLPPGIEKKLGPGVTAEKGADGRTVTSVDTSPREPQPYPGAIPTTSGWGPQPQSPTTAAVSISNGMGVNPSNAPMLPSISAGAQIAPTGTGAPLMFWQQGIAPDFPPTVAFRSGTDALKKFYSNLAGTFRRRRF